MIRFFLGEMDARLLQKIEELTLYTIQQEKSLRFQQNEIETLKKENQELRSLNEKLLELQLRLEKLEQRWFLNIHSQYNDPSLASSKAWG